MALDNQQNISASLESTLVNEHEIQTVWITYFKWFSAFVVLACLASLSAYLSNIFFSFTLIQLTTFQILSLVVEATALGQCGYNIQTWGGTSPAEKLNDRLFIIFSTLGFFLIIFAFQLETKLIEIPETHSLLETLQVRQELPDFKL